MVAERPAAPVLQGGLCMKPIWWQLLFLVMAGLSTLTAQEQTACPAFLPPGITPTCFAGTGSYGSQYLIVMPDNWNSTLILVNVGLTRRLFSEPQSLGATRF